MTFQELGETLQREREAQGLTVKAVMDATKISRVVILALENGDRSALPHPVYTKGFVKSYARLLGLDPDELSMVVDREYQMEPPQAGDLSYDVAPNAEKAFQDNDPAAGRRGRSVWPTLLIVLALAGAAIILALNLNKGKITGTQAPAPVPAEESVQPAAPEGVAPEAAPADGRTAPENVPGIAPEPTPAEEQGGAAQTGQAPTVAPESAPAATESAPAQPAEQAATAQAPAQVPAAPPARAPARTDAADEEAAITQEGTPAEPNYDHVVIIRATSDKGCWIGVWRGDETKMARDFVLRKGEPLRLMFNSPRRIRIGNVSGVTVTYNGNPYDLDLAKGNIQTLLFGM
ncbi:transcriptional regulator, XRE family [Pseudodesulfovibrio mercurii]|uniref:Transcriptional regulator, XRE family n=1 Tax=Pseudodesulfovibrio mercurii TaxID=641491 RepID=F0JEU7_9BACT|nr:helix-turn-helix domain-containing protein [Pseudodesulfovibrio mercurii]EGB13582.1 transcriptional regulator, XRE family [Pseudodesulfovibrio mercurii]